MMILSSLGLLSPQYSLFSASSTFSPTVHETNLNGPVPVGCSNAYEPVGRKTPFRSSPWLAPYFFIAVGLCIANADSDSDGRNGPFFLRSLTTAVYWPFARQLE